MQKPMRFDQLAERRSTLGKASVLTRVAYAVTALACLVGWGGTRPTRVRAEPAQISPNLEQQLKAVMEEKRSRTPAQQKIDTFLLMAVKQRRGEAAPFAPRGVDVAADGTVVVDIQCPVTDSIAEAIEAMGGKVLNRHPRYEMIRARLPLAQLETLASKSMVRSMRLPVPWVTRQGSTIAEGDAAHRADEARSTFGLDGTGVTICAISDGVDNLAARQAAGELPMGSVEILTGQAGEGSEGTAMLEIIHDLAGGAPLGFATALPSPAQYATNIRNLRDVLGCDIIVDDVNYLNESPFQAGVIGEAVQDVVADGAIYVSAAGNDGSHHKETSGTYEGDYVASDTAFEDLFPSLPITGGLHDFDAGANGVNIANKLLHDGLAIAFHWSDPLGGSNNDYDLCLANDDLSQLIACSAFTQNGDDDPFEFIPLAPGGSQALIINFSNLAEDRFLHLQAFNSILEKGTTGSIYGHGGLDEAIAVGAADVVQAGGGAFKGTEEVEAFSSDGPRRVFFDAAGNPFTPGNLSSTGGLLLDKPDVTAADGVTTTTPGFELFFGTSAAAPHAAAVAGLLKQADPTLTPREIEALLEGTATDIEATGFDAISGFGLLNAFNAVDRIGGNGTELINAALRLDHLDMSFDPADSRAPAGVFTIDATFTNVSSDFFADVFFQVTTLTGGHEVLNADGGPGGVGFQVSGPDALDAGETFHQVFEIGLQEASPFRFFVDAFGTPQ